MLRLKANFHLPASSCKFISPSVPPPSPPSSPPGHRWGGGVQSDPLRLARIRSHTTSLNISARQISSLCESSERLEKKRLSSCSCTGSWAGRNLTSNCSSSLGGLKDVQKHKRPVTTGLSERTNFQRCGSFSDREVITAGCTNAFTVQRPPTPTHPTPTPLGPGTRSFSTVLALCRNNDGPKLKL